MLNKSRGEIAYTLVDVDSVVQADCIKRLTAIDGVLKARAL
jgi:D-3-phosphoglycerate dehydrogenase